MPNTRDATTEMARKKKKKKKEEEVYRPLQEYAHRHSFMRGDPDSDQRDDMFSLFRAKIEKTPKDGSKVLALLRAIKKWQDNSDYGSWTPFCGLPTWPRPFEYSCILGACEELSQQGVFFNAKVIEFLTPYIGDALMAVSLEGWDLPHFRVLGIGEFARRLAAGIVEPIHEANDKKAGRLSRTMDKSTAKPDTQSKYRSSSGPGRAPSYAFAGVGAAGASKPPNEAEARDDNDDDDDPAWSDYQRRINKMLKKSGADFMEAIKKPAHSLYISMDGRYAGEVSLHVETVLKVPKEVKTISLRDENDNPRVSILMSRGLPEDGEHYDNGRIWISGDKNKKGEWTLHIELLK